MRCQHYFDPMGISSRPKRAPTKPYHHGKLRAVLLNLALADLESTGAASLSLRDLASRAGVSKTAPYRHFPDRDSLLVALMDEGWKDLYQALERSHSDARNGLSGLRAMGRAYVGFALARPGMYRLLFSGEGKSLSEGLPCPEASDSFQLLEGQIARCQAEGWRPAVDVKILTLAHWSLVHGAADLALENLVATPTGISPLEFWATVVDLVEVPD
jgi:AcrR family transcriptional regulator